MAATVLVRSGHERDGRIDERVVDLLHGLHLVMMVVVRVGMRMSVQMGRQERLM